MDVGNIAPDTIEAVVNSKQSWYAISEFCDRVKAMHQFRSTSDFIQVASTFKRVNNILKAPLEGLVQLELFVTPEESILYKASQQQDPHIQAQLKSGHYISALESIATLRDKVDSLFEKVMINDPDPKVRANRQLLLQQIKHQVLQAADFSEFQD